MKLKRIVLSGATSMLGVALIKECVRQGIQVLAIVNPGSLRINRIPQSNLVKILECSLENLQNMIVPEQNYDIFYHFGWVGTSKAKRLDTVEQTKNISYTLEAVRLAKRLGCHTLIGAGSQAEYGQVSSPSISPDSPIRPDTAYGIAKYASGRLSAILCEQTDMRHIWTRIFSVYGPDDNETTMIMQCIFTLLNNQKPSFTKCEQTWDYLFSEDAGRAFLLIGQYGVDKSIYCVGSGQARPLYEYIKTIRDNIDPGLPLGIGDLPYSNNQVMNLCADISSLQKDTGFEPHINFDQGIEKTIISIRTRRKS